MHTQNFWKNTFNRYEHMFTKTQMHAEVKQLQGGPTGIYICIQVKNSI
ncbi:unnamed protein product [marine sediment metagenome]|uniref:Uncharacterized protein n=1 Tax=marine sediment metagenome TaxID=412755 RepID=X1PS65_9ZZZZ